MKKSKFILITAVLVLLLISLCACSGNEPATGENATNPASSGVDVTVADATAETKDTGATAVSETQAEFTQGENDLEIITVPQNSTEASENTEAATEIATEAVAETTEPRAETTAVQKIELPFVPVN